MAYINRHIEQRINELSKTWSAILLTGPRQSGKTTMLKNLAEKENIGREYISLDDLTVREMAKNDPKMFLQLHKPPIIIDEVQYAPELFTYIKIHVDTYHNPGDFWLTGSQVFSLMKGVHSPAELPFCICRRFLKGKLSAHSHAPLPPILRR